MEINHRTGRCRFLPRIERTSFVNRNASRIGSKFSNAVSDGSANQETIGIALSKKNASLETLYIG